VTDERVRKAARDLLATSAALNPPSIEEAYVLPQFGDWPFAFTRIDAVYVWTQGGYQVGREPDDYPLFLAVDEEVRRLYERYQDAESDAERREIALEMGKLDGRRHAEIYAALEDE